ncbi:MAG TPA: DsrE family protein [Bacteroidota bacterium]|nr:DsrE family protein [Bacteroidota bacterium]
MKCRAFFFSLLFLGVSFTYSQNAPYRVVFDLTSRDSLDQLAAMRLIREITAANPGAELEVVMYGKGFEMVMPEKTRVADELSKAIAHPNVTFKVCEVALKNNKVDKTQLAKGVGTVPDGVYEIISKQHQGWGYIKVGH